METLLLTDEEVKSLLSMRDVIQAVEQAFIEKSLGRVQMPPKVYLFYRKYGGDLRAMPAYLEKYDVSAVKIVNSHPENRVRYGLPTVMAVVVLVNPMNGFPLAIMSGKALTDMRTGAAGGVAVKHLARKDARIVALIGAGAQARTQLEALIEVCEKLEEVRVWSPDDTKNIFVADTQNKYGGIISIVAVESVQEAVRGADIVITATPSTKPLVMDSMVSSGTHFNCIGADAPGKQELDPAILKRSKIVVDDIEQAVHGGEINVPISHGIITTKDIWAEIGEIVAGIKKGRECPEEITVFVSTGLAVQDAVTAKIVYDRAIEKGVGRFIKLV
ncbi:MAG: alanine dehydrogenase [Candidatus Bathyarchaeia archaeon]